MAEDEPGGHPQRAPRRHPRSKELKKEGEISEDDEHRAEEEVQKLTDSFIEKINELLHHKEEEILEI